MNSTIQNEFKAFTDDLHHYEKELHALNNGLCSLINHFRLYYSTLTQEIQDSSQGQVISQVLHDLEINYENLNKLWESFHSNERALSHVLKETN